MIYILKKQYVLVKSTLVGLITISMVLGGVALVSAQEETAVTSNTSSFVFRVAPGEVLPLSVELLNFGGSRRVDVIVTHEIFDEGNERVFEETETVAVETTTSFVKDLIIPSFLSSGTYVVKTSITYPGQVDPAESQFQFQVERKVFGLFLGSFIFHALITVGVGILFGFGGRYLVHRIRISRIKPYTYMDVNQEDRVYYELISDAIMQMRFHEGDEALALARDIPELHIDEEGRVLKVEKNPAKIMALLLLLYERNFGHTIDAQIQSKNVKRNKPQGEEVMEIINKNIEMVRKNFK